MIRLILKNILPIALLTFSLNVCAASRLDRGVYKSTLAFMYMKQGKYKDAEKLFKEELDEEEKVPDPEFGGRMHIGSLDAFLANLAWCYNEQKEFTKAENLYLKEVDLLKQHPFSRVIRDYVRGNYLVEIFL